MKRFYADEDFPFPVVEILREMGHDVLTTREAGNDNLGTPDDEVLSFASAQARAVLTRNRRHFIRLHRLQSDHSGIVVCTHNPDNEQLAACINNAVLPYSSLRGILLRVHRPSV